MSGAVSPCARPALQGVAGTLYPTGARRSSGRRHEVGRRPEIGRTRAIARGDRGLQVGARGRGEVAVGEEREVEVGRARR